MATLDTHVESKWRRTRLFLVGGGGRADWWPLPNCVVLVIMANCSRTRLERRIAAFFNFLLFTISHASLTWFLSIAEKNQLLQS
jgi:hypothetical protein